MTEPLDWSGPAPRSSRFDDIYFSPEDGLAESRAVFLEGCELPSAWAGRDRFVVGELGFGTGLNLLALVELWSATRVPGARLHMVSVEAHPLSRADGMRALGRWAELEPFSRALLAAWPEPRPGFHRIELPEDAILDLWIGDAAEGLTAWDGAADAWFLDGFAPARNPAMWSPELLALVAARSAPGARAASFTVAGGVRRGLQAAGFEIAKRPGFGAKRERLEAWLSPAEPRPAPRPRVAIVGAGIAGASLARACRALGLSATVVEADAPGTGASGNPAALVMPRLDAGGGAVAALHAQALDRAVQLYREVPGAVIAEGALQLEVQPRDAGRFDRLAAWDGFAPGAFERLDAKATAAALDEAGAPGCLACGAGLVVEPGPILNTWLAETPTVRAEVAGLERGDGVWRLTDAEGGLILEAEVVCLASGPAAARLADLPLRAVRGQASWTEAVAFSGAPAAWGGYAVPLKRGVLFGATHDRDDWSLESRTDDDEHNRGLLAQGRPRLAERIAGTALESRASLRAATPDHLPLAGRLEEGLFVLSGFGGRGFTLAPVLAEHVAALAVEAPSPLPRVLAAAVDPGRYDRRTR